MNYICENLGCKAKFSEPNVKVFTEKTENTTIVTTKKMCPKCGTECFTEQQTIQQTTIQLPYYPYYPYYPSPSDTNPIVNPPIMWCSNNDSQQLKS